MRMKSMYILAAVGAIMTAAGGALAKVPPKQTDLDEALKQAKAENKLLFVQFGRETCGNCQALKSMIQQRQIRLSDSDFVYADLNCDEAAAHRAFATRFKVEGRTLPFVVIADPDGKQLAARNGYGTAAEFRAFIKDAERAYDKEHKAPAEPRRKPVRPKPRSSGIAPDDNREVRSWAAANGDQVTAALVEERAGIVILKKEDGTKIQIRTTFLSKSDQEYLDRLREEDSTPAAEE